LHLILTFKKNDNENTNLIFSDNIDVYLGELRFDSSRYEYVEGWVSFIWRDFYVNTLGESITIREIYGDDPTYKNALAQLEIWMCAEWARITQIFGDIAYFGAGMGGEVAYTSESEIYNDLFARLDAAVKAIDATDTSQFAFNQDDLIYRSDMEKWKRFGNSIRLRLAMRLANIDPARAQAEASAFCRVEKRIR